MLSANITLDWKVIASYKHSSLFGLVVSEEGKKFYNIDPRTLHRRLQWLGCSTNDPKLNIKAAIELLPQLWHLINDVQLALAHSHSPVNNYK